ncbi:MAG: hypothetical protein NT076_03060 [Candidatus Pacearchaeota archaeon]|nr:hypothetical protein [Candidatus Pacearchaeota archaeon]
MTTPLDQSIRRRIENLHKISLEGNFIGWGNFRRIEEDIKLALQNFQEDLKFQARVVNDDDNLFLPYNLTIDLIKEYFGTSLTETNSQEVNLGDNSYTMCDTTSAKRKSDYIAMSENTRKQNVDESQEKRLEQEATPLHNKKSDNSANLPLGSNSNNKKGCGQFFDRGVWLGIRCGDIRYRKIQLCDKCKTLGDET